MALSRAVTASQMLRSSLGSLSRMVPMTESLAKSPAAVWPLRSKSFLSGCSLAAAAAAAAPLRIGNVPFSASLHTRATSRSGSDGTRGAGYGVYDENRVPTMAETKRLPFEYAHLPHDVLLSAALNDSSDAKEELLVRNVMAVDEVEYAEAALTVSEIKSDNTAYMWLATMPYKIGVGFFLSAGLLSFPLCFHLETVLTFNDVFVTFEPAGEGELDTWLEVGAWAWNWMEPPLGQLSFFILTMQIVGGCMGALGYAPYGDWMADKRAKRLKTLYPNYNARVLTEFAKTQSPNPATDREYSTPTPHNGGAL